MSPRQIIDTESSRPQYVRRMVLTAFLVVLAIVLIIVAGLEVWAHLSHVPVPGK